MLLYKLHNAHHHPCWSSRVAVHKGFCLRPSAACNILWVGGLGKKKLVQPAFLPYFSSSLLPSNDAHNPGCQDLHVNGFPYAVCLLVILFIPVYRELPYKAVLSPTLQPLASKSPSTVTCLSNHLVGLAAITNVNASKHPVTFPSGPWGSFHEHVAVWRDLWVWWFCLVGCSNAWRAYLVPGAGWDLLSQTCVYFKSSKTLLQQALLLSIDHDLLAGQSFANLLNLYNVVKHGHASTAQHLSEFEQNVIIVNWCSSCKHRNYAHWHGWIYSVSLWHAEEHLLLCMWTYAGQAHGHAVLKPWSRSGGHCCVTTQPAIRSNTGCHPAATSPHPSTLTYGRGCCWIPPRLICTRIGTLRKKHSGDDCICECSLHPVCFSRNFRAVGMGRASLLLDVPAAAAQEQHFMKVRLKTSSNLP